MTHAPTLFLEPALADRGLQASLRLSGRCVFGRIEDREVFTNNFVGTIALDALGTTIPRRDVAICVEHEDPVIRHVFNHQPESFFARAQL